MNLVGKIFTVLIFFMCVVFATFALMVHAAHKNWRDETFKANDQLIKANQERQVLIEEKKSLENAREDERVRMRSRLTALERAAEKAIADRNEMEGKFLKVDEESRRLVMALQGAEKHLGVLQTEIDGMRNDIKLTVEERNKAQKDLVDATDALQNALNEVRRLEKLQRELVAQINQLKVVLQFNHIPPVILKTPPVGLEGEVTAVPRRDTVEISVGNDDGVRKGHKFVVTRPSTGKYIGIIEVINADSPNRAVCRPVPGSQNDQIQKGDHVKAETKPG